MSDDIDFDDLFALPEPKPSNTGQPFEANLPDIPRFSSTSTADPSTVRDSRIVETAAAYACPCGLRCEVIQPAPTVIKCLDCKWETMARYVSPYPVPVGNAIRVEAGT